MAKEKYFYNHYCPLKNKEFNQKQKLDKIKPKIDKNYLSHYQNCSLLK